MKDLEWDVEVAHSLANNIQRIRELRTQKAREYKERYAAKIHDAVKLMREQADKDRQERSREMLTRDEVKVAVGQKWMQGDYSEVIVALILETASVQMDTGRVRSIHQISARKGYKLVAS